MERGRLACQTILSLKFLGENVINNVELIDNFTREKAIDKIQLVVDKHTTRW
jgi:hypothetical protein